MDACLLLLDGSRLSCGHVFLPVRIQIVFRNWSVTSIKPSTNGVGPSFPFSICWGRHRNRHLQPRSWKVSLPCGGYRWSGWRHSPWREALGPTHFPSSRTQGLQQDRHCLQGAFFKPAFVTKTLKESYLSQPSVCTSVQPAFTHK